MYNNRGGISTEQRTTGVRWSAEKWSAPRGETQEGNEEGSNRARDPGEKSEGGPPLFTGPATKEQLW